MPAPLSMGKHAVAKRKCREKKRKGLGLGMVPTRGRPPQLLVKFPRRPSLPKNRDPPWNSRATPEQAEQLLKASKLEVVWREEAKAAKALSLFPWNLAVPAPVAIGPTAAIGPTLSKGQQQQQQLLSRRSASPPTQSHWLPSGPTNKQGV
jgi:hypothetical protein